MKKFIAYFFFIKWSCISFGFHIDIASPNIEIHIPFGFFRIGWEKPMRFYYEDKTYGWYK